MANATTEMRRKVELIIPREVVGPVVLVFSVENVIDILFSRYMPTQSELIGWLLVLFISITILNIWNEAQEEDEEANEIIEH